MVIVVYHDYYGCETGCCGHRIEMSEENEPGLAIETSFIFDHPYFLNLDDEPAVRHWLEYVIEEEFPGHTHTIDFSRCIISRD